MWKTYFVYLGTSAPYGALYPGVTNNLVRRFAEHKAGVVSGFTKRYGVDQLVWFEIHTSIEAAISREGQIWSALEARVEDQPLPGKQSALDRPLPGSAGKVPGPNHRRITPTRVIHAKAGIHSSTSTGREMDPCLRRGDTVGPRFPHLQTTEHHINSDLRRPLPRGNFLHSHRTATARRTLGGGMWGPWSCPAAVSGKRITGPSGGPLKPGHLSGSRPRDEAPTSGRGESLTKHADYPHGAIASPGSPHEAAMDCSKPGAHGCRALGRVKNPTPDLSLPSRRSAPARDRHVRPFRGGSAFTTASIATRRASASASARCAAGVSAFLGGSVSEPGLLRGTVIHPT